MNHDLFGQALHDRSKGEIYPFYFWSKGQRFTHDLARYFRSPQDLSTYEKELIKLSYGNILDVGCGTGHYLPVLKNEAR